jgi:hypothetical protein
MVNKNTKVALILDNCPSHPFVSLSNVKLIFLPPNTTSRLQAMDMGVIHALKCSYRSKLARKLLALLEKKPKPTVKDIDLYDSLIMLKDSWNEISEQTIRNCFIKSGLKFSDQQLDENVFEEVYDSAIWNELNERFGLEGSEFEDYVNFDDDIAICDEISSDTVNETNHVSDEDLTLLGVGEEEEEEEEEDMNESQEQIKTIDALNAISQLRKYVTQCDGLEKTHNILNELEKEIYKNKFCSSKQSKITDFFSLKNHFSVLIE